MRPGKSNVARTLTINKARQPPNKGGSDVSGPRRPSYAELTGLFAVARNDS
jgi:hypothetical protein